MAQTRETMKPPTKTINLPWLAIVLLTAAFLFAIGFARITIDTDIVESLPTGDPVIADAIYIFKNHPVKDRIAIDIGIGNPDPDRLVAIARQVEKALEQSGLFAQVGMDDTRNAVAELVYHVVDYLPKLFTAVDLERRIRPLLTPENIRRQMKLSVNALYGMDGIGQAALIEKDPLGLRNLILADLSRLIPETTGRIHRGQLVSADGKHGLVLATPRHSATDTRYAARITTLMENIASDLESAGDRPRLTPVGAYRAALDNETIIRKDVGRALIGATIGIALLLLLAFSRPLIGLMALVPALAGTILAFFVFALFSDHISIMVLGFGGAIISITVDQGIAYLLFVDSAEQITGEEASREIRAIGLLAALTSVGAFALLGISGFPVFQQLGLFTALGIGFSFLFVHTVFPRIFPGRPDKAPVKPRILNRLVDRCTSFGKPAAIGAICLAGVMPFAFNLQFNTDLSAMNSMSRATLEADALMQNVWGNIFSRVHLLVEAQDPAKLQQKNDRLLNLLETEETAGHSTGGFTASRFFPGQERAGGNLAAWQQFWNPARTAAVRAALEAEGARIGFAGSAFDPFYRTLQSTAGGPPAPVPPGLYPLLGISVGSEGTPYRQVTGIRPLDGYNGGQMHARLGTFVKIFDPALFSDRLGKLLSDTFGKMLLIIGTSVVILLLIFFADPGLTVVALLPLLFSFNCTLGTLGLMGRTLDIPALMLAIIIFGMGVDYSLFVVRAYQRYQDFNHALFGLTRMAVFMAAVSTLIGFAVICGAEHNTLKSAGIVSFLGIGYCLVGAFLILPPLLKRRFEAVPKTGPDRQPAERYHNMETYPRMFARFKLKYDPMFTELGHLLPDASGIRNIIDVGCGYGIPDSWLLSRYPAATIYGIEPEPDRVRVAARALGGQGHITRGAAPQLPDFAGTADLAVMLDMNHFLDDDAFNLALVRLRKMLAADGCLIVRAVIPPTRAHSWSWWFENLKMKLNQTPAFYRSIDQTAALLTTAGYELTKESTSGPHAELHWFVARPSAALQGGHHR